MLCGHRTAVVLVVALAVPVRLTRAGTVWTVLGLVLTLWLLSEGTLGSGGAGQRMEGPGWCWRSVLLFGEPADGLACLGKELV